MFLAVLTDGAFCCQPLLFACVGMLGCVICWICSIGATRVDLVATGTMSIKVATSLDYLKFLHFIWVLI